MKTIFDSGNAGGRINRDAAAWAVRQDRGLAPEEEAELNRWLALDPRHAEALALQQHTWNRLDLLERGPHSRPEPAEIVASTRTRGWFRAIAAVAAVAAIGAGFFFWQSAAVSPQPLSALALQPIEERVLEDGSTIRLNRGARVIVQFTPGERRVILEQGEAIFEVAKNPHRPFVVSAGDVQATALGTAFDVNHQGGKVSVLVAEGYVSLKVAVPAGESPPPAGREPVLTAQQRAVVSLGQERASMQIDTLSVQQVESMLAWRPVMFDFTEATLAEVVASFNSRNTVRLVIADRNLAEFRLSATLRSDNVDGFLRLLESNFHVRATHRAGGEIALTWNR